MRRDCGWGGLQTLPLKVTFLHSFLAFMPLSFSTQSQTAVLDFFYTTTSIGFTQFRYLDTAKPTITVYCRGLLETLT